MRLEKEHLAVLRDIKNIQDKRLQPRRLPMFAVAVLLLLLVAGALSAVFYHPRAELKTPVINVIRPG